MSSPVTVIYVMGRAYSGAQFVRHMIAHRGGIADLGALRRWPVNYDENHLCSCGEPKPKCPFWAPVIDGLENRDEVALAFEKTTKRSFLISLIMPDFVNKRLHRDLPEKLAPIYNRIRSVHGREIVLDSSDDPAFGTALANTDGLDVVFIHVVRHPLAVVYAHKVQRQKNSETGSGQSGPSPIRAALEWTAANLLYELAKFRSPLKSTFVRGEKLGDPSLQDVLVHHVDVIAGGTAQSELQHLMAGEPGHVWTEADELLDMEWKTGLRMAEKLLYGALTYPLFAFYMRRPALD